MDWNNPSSRAALIEKVGRTGKAFSDIESARLFASENPITEKAKSE